MTGLFVVIDGSRGRASDSTSSFHDESNHFLAANILRTEFLMFIQGLLTRAIWNRLILDPFFLV